MREWIVEIKILKKTKNELKIEVTGEGHTFCNVVQKALLKNKKVDMAGYDIPHPLTSSPIIYIRTKGRSKPEIALRDAVKELRKESHAFSAAFDQALNQWQS